MFLKLNIANVIENCVLESLYPSCKFVISSCLGCKLASERLQQILRCVG